MNKLLALSIALLSLNLYGADKTPREIALEKENKELKAKVTELTKVIEVRKFMAEKLKLKEELSRRGLEGWGKKEGVKIGVEDYSEDDKTFDLKAIKNQIELKLRVAGIKVIDGQDSFDSIYISMQPISSRERIIGYSLMIRPQRMMSFKYNGKEYIAFGANKRDYSGISGPKYRSFLDEQMDQLLLDYLKANPKKEEK